MLRLLSESSRIVGAEEERAVPLEGPREIPQEETCHCVVKVVRGGLDFISGWGMRTCVKCKGFIGWGVR